MPALQVRDFPEELYEQLKALAARNHRSVAQQTIACVEQAILRESVGEGSFRVVLGGRRGGSRTSDSVYAPRFDTEAERAARLEKRKALFKEIERLPKIVVPEGFPSVEEIVREGHEERDRRIMESLGFYDDSCCKEA